MERSCIICAVIVNAVCTNIMCWEFEKSEVLVNKIIFDFFPYLKRPLYKYKGQGLHFAILRPIVPCFSHWQNPAS